MFERSEILCTIADPFIQATLSSIGLFQSPTMENPVDRTIRLMTFAVGVVSLLVYAVFHFV